MRKGRSSYGQNGQLLQSCGLLVHSGYVSQEIALEKQTRRDAASHMVLWPGNEVCFASKP
jgi:hypothetical protein